MSAHRSRFRIYYEDTDAGGIVYHARYLGFAERARAEALRSLGLPVGELAREEGLGFVVRRLQVEYAASLKLDEEMEIETVLKSEKGARLFLEQRIYRRVPDHETKGGGENESRPERKEPPVVTPAVTISVELACLCLETMQPVRIPSYCRVKLAGLAP